MAGSNGTNGAVQSPTKRRLLIIGGHEGQLPPWTSVFEIEHLGTERLHGKLAPARRADAVIVLVDQCSYSYSCQAYEFGREWEVPVMRSSHGWSAAVSFAAKIGLDWFVNGVQAGGEAIATKNPPRAEEAQQLVENAWKGTADYQADRAKALEKQLNRERVKREQLEGTLARLRSGAETRIVAEIRRRASEIKSHEHERLVPIRKAAADLVRSVRKAQATMAQALGEVDRARSQLNKLLDDESVESGHSDEVD